MFRTYIYNKGLCMSILHVNIIVQACTHSMTVETIQVSEPLVHGLGFILENILETFQYGITVDTNSKNKHFLFTMPVRVVHIVTA